MNNENRKLGILVGGGPAPGINSVIGTATIRARLANIDVVGLVDGFRWIMQGDISHVVPLTISETSRIHFRGGSYIGISRTGPSDEASIKVTLDALDRLNIDKLITIGGDGTAYIAYLLATASRGALRVVHVPKTIDNDLALPNDISSFGFQTARSIGVEIVKNLMVDAKTTSRWYYVVAQGRKAGHLALSIGKAAGATLSVIPEEFQKGATPLSTIVDTLAGAIIKRRAYGREDGVAMLAEGLAECIDPNELSKLVDVPRDKLGNIHVAEVPLGDILRKAVQARLGQFGIKATIVAKQIGYEVRCADPIPFDMEYTRDLGYCAARYILDGGSNVMVSMQAGSFVPIPFDQLIDIKSGRTRVRMVDIESDRYKIARTYMLRLKRGDFEDPSELAKLAAICGITPMQFRHEFGYLGADEYAPMSAKVVAQRGSAV